MLAHLPRLPFALHPLIAEAKWRARQRRVLVALAVVLLAGLAAGLTLAFRPSGGGGPSGGFAKATYPQYGVSLRYPSAWTRVDWCSIGLDMSPIALLTTSRPAPTCNPHSHVNPWSWPPPQRLGTNGISLALSNNAALAYTPVGKTEPTWNSRIAGQPAKMWPPTYGRKLATEVTCPAGVQRESRSVTVWRSALNAVFAVNAVICGPDLAAGDRALRHVLASIRFTQ